MVNCSGEAAAAVWRVGAGGLEFAGPIGVRDEHGSILPLENAQADMKDPSPTAEAVFAGVEERIPRHVGQLVSCNGVVHPTYAQILRAATTGDELWRDHADTEGGTDAGLALFCASLSPELSSIFSCPFDAARSPREFEEISQHCS